MNHKLLLSEKMKQLSKTRLDGTQFVSAGHLHSQNQLKDYATFSLFFATNSATNCSPENAALL